jgi:hypothetical protein
MREAKWKTVPDKVLKAIWADCDAGRKALFNGCTHHYLAEIYGVENLKHVPGVGWIYKGQPQ